VGVLKGPQVNDLRACNCFHFMVFGKLVLPISLLFPGVISMFALFLSNLYINHRLQRVAGGWPEWRQLLVHRRL
jgi:hypothetical protein